MGPEAIIVQPTEEALVAPVRVPEPGNVIIYRGVKGEWLRPSISNDDLKTAMDRFDDLIVTFTEGGSLTESEKDEFKALDERIRYEKDQYFSDTREDAINYAGAGGTVVSIEVSMRKLLDEAEVRESGFLPGSNGRMPTVIIVPREWLLVV